MSSDPLLDDPQSLSSEHSLGLDRLNLCSIIQNMDKRISQLERENVALTEVVRLLADNQRANREKN